MRQTNLIITSVPYPKERFIAVLFLELTRIDKDKEDYVNLANLKICITWRLALNNSQSNQRQNI